MAETSKDALTEGEDVAKTAEMASLTDMFSFAKTQRCKTLIGAAFALAAVTGSVFPGGLLPVSM